jgi:hypothetical protein
MISSHNEFNQLRACSPPRWPPCSSRRIATANATNGAAMLRTAPAPVGSADRDAYLVARNTTVNLFTRYTQFIRLTKLPSEMWRHVVWILFVYIVYFCLQHCKGVKLETSLLRKKKHGVRVLRRGLWGQYLDLKEWTADHSGRAI